MQYFVTGATGFIGKRLVKQAAGAQGVGGAFPDSQGKRIQGQGLREFWGASAARVVPVFGDLTRRSWASRPMRQGAQGQDRPFLPPGRGLRPGGRRGAARSRSTSRARATRWSFAKAVDAGHFHHVSSIAAAGLYEGVFREDMFDEAENSITRTS
jgi:hypothetical protein